MMPNYSEMIKEDNAKLLNVKDKFKSLTVSEIFTARNTQTLPFAVGLLNITGDLNMGMIIRSAEIFGAEQVLIWGRQKIDNRSLVGADNYIPISWFGQDANLEINPVKIDHNLKVNGYYPVLIEQGSRDLTDLHTDIASMEKFVYPGYKPCFIFGREAHGISKEILAYFEDKALIVSIPQRGALRSLNVSAAANCVMWEYVRKFNVE